MRPSVRRCCGLSQAIPVVGGLVLVLAVPAPAGRAPAPPLGTIAFERAGAAGSRIWLTSADGSQQRPVETRGDASDPAWSRSGALAFVSIRQGRFTVFQTTAQGQSVKPVTKGALAKARPVFSPDGRTLAYEGGVPGRANVFSLEADSGTATARTVARADDGSPTWSPNGRALAFSSNRSGPYRIYVKAVPTIPSRVQPVPQPLTSGPGHDLEPRWSPDGSRIAFTRLYRGNYDIWTIDVSTRRARRLTRQAAQDFQPTWSPDSRYLAFVSSRNATRDNANYDVYVMEADGDGQRRVTRSPEPEISPAWAPASVRPPGPRRTSSSTKLTCSSGSYGPDELDGTMSGEEICGKSGNDIIRGGGGDDTIYGGDGKDIIQGGPGRDTIYGGSGKDRIHGGRGDDDLWSRDSAKDVIRGGPGTPGAALDKSKLRDPYDDVGEIP